MPGLLDRWDHPGQLHPRHIAERNQTGRIRQLQAHAIRAGDQMQDTRHLLLAFPVSTVFNTRRLWRGEPKAACAR